MVNYWKLFPKLLDDSCNSSVITILAFWYSHQHQQVCVRWRNSLSSSFHSDIANGTRQGGILSPTLFSRYIRDLLAEITQLHVGCNIGGLFVNVLAYADDIVLLAPSWSALQHLLSALQQHVSNIDMICSTKKSVCMIFEPRDRTKIMNVSFQQFTLEGCSLQFVKMFKYLASHMITDSMTTCNARFVICLSEPIYSFGVLASVLLRSKLSFSRLNVLVFTMPVCG